MASTDKPDNTGGRPTRDPHNRSTLGESTIAYFTPQRIRILAIAGAATVVVALIVWFVITAGRRKQAYAANELQQAQAAAEQGNLGVAVQGFTHVVTAYGGTRAAYEATIGIAKSRLINGQAELAITGLITFVESNPPDTYRAAGYSLLGTAYENVGKFKEAADAYRKASDLAAFDYLKAANLLDAGRASTLANQPQDAEAIYREIIAKYGETAAMTEAQVRLAELTAKAS